MNKLQRLFLVALWLAATPASADIIIGPPDFPLLGAGGILGGSYFQSFTATIDEPQAAVVSFCWGGTFNGFLPDPVMTARLRSGAGLTGSVLGSRTIGAIPDSTVRGTWIDFIFNAPVPLTAGAKYTLEFAPQSSAHTSGSVGEVDNFVYPGGGFISGSGQESNSIDLAFRVLSAPEPGSIGVIAFVAVVVYCCRPSRKNR